MKPACSFVHAVQSITLHDSTYENTIIITHVIGSSTHMLLHLTPLTRFGKEVH